MATIQELMDDTRTHTLSDWIPVSKMAVDRWARPASEKTIKRRVVEWDARAVGELKVSYRHLADIYMVLDGQHRWQAALRLGIEALPCRIYLDLTYAEEAALHTKFNTVNPPNASARFNSRLEANEREAIEIRRIVHGQGLQLALVRSRSKGPRAVGAVAALEQVYDKHGGAVLAETLRLLDVGLPNQQRTFSTGAIMGLGAFLRRYATHEHYDDKRLVAVLNRWGADEWHQRAMAMRSAHIGGNSQEGVFGQTLLALYNHGVRQKTLPPWEDRVFPTIAPETASARARASWATRRENLAAKGAD